jgi:hypothetical protein
VALGTKQPWHRGPADGPLAHPGRRPVNMSTNRPCHPDRHSPLRSAYRRLALCVNPVDACPNTRDRGICTRTGQAHIGDCLPPTKPHLEGSETLRLVSNAKHSRTANESGGVRTSGSARSRPICNKRRTCLCPGRRSTRRCRGNVVGAPERPGLPLGRGPLTIGAGPRRAPQSRRRSRYLCEAFNADPAVIEHQSNP